MAQKSKILIVDDDESIRDTYEQILSTEGYDLYFAADGYQGIAMAEQHKPDLVMLDIMMPGMTGFEVCRRIRQTPLLAEMPILMITALDDHESAIKGLETGADDYIVKPFSRREICARVRTITRLNRYRRMLNDQIRLRWIIGHADDGYLILNGDDRIIFSNPAARRLLELPDMTDSQITEPFARLAKKIYQLKPPEAWQGWLKSADANAERFLVRSETDNSDILWLKAEVMETDSPTPEYLVCLKDITRNVIDNRISWNIQDQLNHKIRTALNGLSGSLMVLNEARSMPETEKREFIAAAYQKSSELQDELLDILRYKNALRVFEIGDVPFDPRSFPELITTIAASLGIAPVELAYDDDKMAKGMIRLTYPAVRTIIREILENSKKFHPFESPRVEIRVSRPDSDHYGIRISDDGVNLSPVQLAKIWTPFYQGERYFTGNVPGIGLGLSIVASIIIESGGDFRAYNRADKPGMIIELMLPFEPNVVSV